MYVHFARAKYLLDFIQGNACIFVKKSKVNFALGNTDIIS